MKIIKIAILGATSHIGKGLIYYFSKDKKYQLFLFARAPQRVKSFLKYNSIKPMASPAGYNNFFKNKHDVIINCVGIGSPSKLKEHIASIFQLTETYDNMVIDYLKIHPCVRYINFSSGAIYGSNFREPVQDNSTAHIAVNNIGPQDYYSIAKINSETKHRALCKLNIVDIRVFSYFSRFIDIDAGYFITDIIKSIKQKSKFITNSRDFIRDYLHPFDLFNFVKVIIEGGFFNAAIDAYSRAPVSKFLLMDYFSKTYGLKYKLNRTIGSVCPTGIKNAYYSISRKATALGYKPKFSSIETIAAETKYILGAGNE